jgi:tetratricopeptide (TPR) repeat protein
MAAKQENIMGSGSNQEERQNFSRNYPVDKEQGRGSCLVLPGSQRWKNRSKQEEQRVSLLGHESPVSASTRLTAWTSDTADTEEFTDYFPEDPFNASRKKKNKEQSSSARGREQQPRAITPEALLQAPKPSERRRRRSYDGEREPDGVRGQEATVPPDSMLQGPNPSGRPRRKSFEGEEEPSGVRGQEAKLTKSKRSSKSKSKEQPSDDGAPMMRSFSEEGARKSSSSLRFVTPQEQAPPARQSSRRRNSSSPDNEQDDGGDKDDGRSPRLSLLPVSETSIPEGVEEASTTDGEESSNDRPMSMRSFGGNTGSSKPQSIDEYSPQDVREFRSSSTDIRKHMQGGGRTTSDSVSPPTPRMRKLPDESSARPKELLPSVQQMASKSHSSDDLKDMMPDLMPTPQSSYASSTGKGSSSRGRGKSYASSSALESPSNDTTDVNYIHALENVEALNAAAVENVEHGEYDAALASFEQVLSIYKGMHGEAHPLVASTYHNLGMVHSKRAALLLDGTFHQNHCRQQSLECFQAAARTGRDSLGPNHPNVAVSLVRIGFLLLQARQYQNAFVTFREALRIRLAHFGKETPHSLVANLYNNLGVCKMHLGQYKEGSSLLKTALEIQRKVLRLKRQEKDISRSELRNCLLEIADTLCNLGGLYLEWIRQQGPDPRNSTEAEAAFAEALEVSFEHILNMHCRLLSCSSLTLTLCVCAFHRFGPQCWGQSTNSSTKFGLYTKWLGRHRYQLLYQILIVR